ncbi:polysaccharide biosynthesis/export family protein [Sulfitobacter sp. F26204]|uniref:polysaccharide biosynthesis/export family protein n=1 Tax=Sulfitobacter sp. F26204 TaxID=2996014 RepID=UPI00225E359D|nr:polysaccharide biosynthesis/export family protein [Sulfitobacter sp. F26204]MCX7561619.1 polysaccharide biosynthesis/export family protein [Sulfitobacter sp. F26204]
MLKFPFTAALVLFLASCGTVYVSPKVDARDGKVRVLPVNAETVLVANRAKYNPKQLPAVFFQNAGGAGAARGAGLAPTTSLNEQRRPAAMTLRVPPNANPGPYRIGVGDVLLLATKSGGTTVEELSGLLAAQNSRQGYTVQDDGAIAVPGVGRVQLNGLTLEEAEAQLFQSLVQAQIDPTFSLEIAEFNSKRVSLGGAVANPTVAPIRLTPLYLDEALAAAGGVASSDLDFASIRIYRDGTLYQIPLEEYLRRGDLQKVRLVDGDSVFVDTEFELDKAQAYFQEQITLAQFRQQGRVQALAELNAEVNLRRASLTEARTNFRDRVEFDAVDRDFVYLTGEVSKPGRFTMPFGRQATLADALYSEGGFSSETGNPSQIYVLRGSSNPADLGAVTAWHLDTKNAANLSLATRFKMQPNDIVFIAEQPITRWNRALKQIFPSIISTANAATN